MQYNKDQQMTSMGVATPKTVIHKSESHKLHQAFPVKSGETILQGMPVQINTDGTISPYYGTGVYVGVAITNSEYPSYEANNGLVEVTVAVEGYIIVCGLSQAALNAGAVTPAELKDDQRYVSYKAATDDTNPKFIALQKAEAADELIHVLIR